MVQNRSRTLAHFIPRSIICSENPFNNLYLKSCITSTGSNLPSTGRSSFATRPHPCHIEKPGKSSYSSYHRTRIHNYRYALSICCHRLVRSFFASYLYRPYHRPAQGCIELLSTQVLLRTSYFLILTRAVRRSHSFAF